MRVNKLLGAILLILIVGAGAWFYFQQKREAPQPQPQPAAPKLVATAHYQCDGGKTADARYYQGESKPPTGPGQPPTPSGSVKLQLSDGRSLTLAQTISADGTRYANTEGSLVFWSKGNGAFVTENDQQTYAGCIQVAPDPGGLPQVYESGSQSFSIRYPADYTLDDTYTYQALGPGKDIAGVKFTISSSTAAGTNLAPDSYLSVEQIPQVQNCNAALFLDGGPKMNVATTTIGGTEYSIASSTGAGAGNRYAETVYAMPWTAPCMAVRYFIHYGVLENYPPGSVKQFDEHALRMQFDAMRRTLTIAP